MDIVFLDAKTRTASGKGPSRRLRRDGMVPAVTYKCGEPTLNIAVPRSELRGILLSKRGKNTLIDLRVDGADSKPVMVKEYTVHPLTRLITHADFVAVDRDKPVTLEVPFNRTGRSKGEVEGGTLLQTTRSLKVRCVPANVPSAIEADSTELEIDDVLRVKDLTLPEGVEVLHPLDYKLVVVQPPRVEETPEEEEGLEGEEGEEGAAPAEGEEGAAKPADGKDAKADDAKKD